MSVTFLCDNHADVYARFTLQKILISLSPNYDVFFTENLNFKDNKDFEILDEFAKEILDGKFNRLSPMDSKFINELSQIQNSFKLDKMKHVNVYEQLSNTMLRDIILNLKSGNYFDFYFDEFSSGENLKNTREMSEQYLDTNNKLDFNTLALLRSYYMMEFIKQKGEEGANIVALLGAKHCEDILLSFSKELVEKEVSYLYIMSDELFPNKELGLDLFSLRQDLKPYTCSNFDECLSLYQSQVSGDFLPDSVASIIN